MDSAAPIKNTSCLFIILIILITGAIYFNALFNGFVYDDNYLIATNKYINDIRSIYIAFTDSTWAFISPENRAGKIVVSNYYRPIQTTTLILTYQIFGLREWGYHLVSIILHILITILVFFISKELLGEKCKNIYPLFSALIFAVHPIHTESVTWIAAVTDLDFTLFYLSGFYIYIKKGWSKSGMISVPLLFFLGLLSKEMAVTFPIILMLYDYSFKKDPLFSPSVFKRYLPLAGVVAVYFIMRINAIGGFAPQSRHIFMSNYDMIINIFPLIIQYLNKLLFPIQLNAFYPFEPIASITDNRAVISIIILIIIFTFLISMIKKERLLFLSVSWIFITLMPVLYIKGVGENVFTERYLYIPSVGFCILIGYLAYKIDESFREKKIYIMRIIFLNFFLVLILYSYQTIVRNRDWKDNITIFSKTVKTSPDSSIAHYNKATALHRGGQLDEAIAEYKIVLGMDPNLMDAHYSLGVAYQEKGEIDKAMREYEESLRIDPHFIKSLNNLGLIYKEKGLFEKGIEKFKKALEIIPDSSRVRINLGHTYYKKGLFDKAINEYLLILKNEPYNLGVHLTLGDAYLKKKKKDPDKAISEYNKVLEINPETKDIHYRIGYIYANTGRYKEAISEWEKELNISPDNKRLLEDIKRLEEIMSKQQ
ncbi:MAG: tetratricopeptide repeat protein [Nitrospirota bacterium]